MKALLQKPRRGPRAGALALAAAAVTMAAVACSTPATPTRSAPDKPAGSAARAIAGPGEAAATPGAVGSPAAAQNDGEPLTSVFRELNPNGQKKFDMRFFRQLLGRDDIRPVYNPVAIGPEETSLTPEDLVIGVSLGGESRAYPIRTLRRREMVNDVVGGTPILATW